MTENNDYLEKQVTEALQKINDAEDKQPLIEAFLNKYPEHQHWLTMFERNEEGKITFNQRMPEIPGYDLKKSLGSGASGHVFLAKLEKNDQSCAIKVAKQHLSKEQLHRFLHESRLLANLSHPHIAQLHTSGILTSDQLPYIVMEHVDGVSIVDYVKSHEFDLKQTVVLFLQVLDAVQYAHHKGIVHRDLKPENILVDDNGQVKLLDFGIALATDNSTQQLTQLTKTGEIVGTLAYMSPEQVSGQSGLDTRADVYSLGVVLYQLLSGTLPHQLDSQQIFLAISQIIEDLPIKIVTHNSKIDAGLAAIVHHALEKKPHQRYQSPGDFKIDLQHWLNGDAISVKDNSLWRSLKHISRKHKALVAGSALAILGLLTGLIFAVSFALKEQQARIIAENNAKTNEKTVQFINEIFSSADPENLYGEELTLLQVINNADTTLIKQLDEEFAVEANIRNTIAGVYIGLGQADLAQKQIDAVNLLYPKLKDYEKLDEIKFNLMNIQSTINKYNNKYVDDINYLNGLLETVDFNFEQKQIVQVELVNSLLSDGKLSEAEVIINEVLDKYDGYLPKSDTNVLQAMVSKAIILEKAGKFEESKKIYQEVITYRKATLGEKHPKTLTAMNNLTAVERHLGNLAKASELFKRIIEIKTEVLGAEHLSTLISKSNLLSVMVDRGELLQADEYSQKITVEFNNGLGPLHSRTLEVNNMRAYLLEDLGKLSEAEQIYRNTLLKYKEAGTTTGPGLFGLQNNLAMLLMKQSSFTEAQEIFGHLLDNVDSILGKEHIYYAIFVGNYGELLLKMQEYEKAEPLLQSSYEKISATFGEQHDRTVKAKKRLEQLQQEK